MRKLTVRLLFFIAISLAISMGTNAAIYKFYDKDGNVVFADQPGPNAEVIEERQLQTIKSIKIRPTTKRTNDKTKSAFSYDELAIVSPENDQTIRENSGDLNVDISVKPELKEKLGHKLVLLLDGKPVSDPGSATSFALHKIDRGQHSLAVRIIGKQDDIIMSSDSITVHIRRFSIQHPKPANSPSTNTPAPPPPPVN